MPGRYFRGPERSRSPRWAVRSVICCARSRARRPTVRTRTIWAGARRWERFRCGCRAPDACDGRREQVGNLPPSLRRTEVSCGLSLMASPCALDGADRGPEGPAWVLRGGAQRVSIPWALAVSLRRGAGHICPAPVGSGKPQPLLSPCSLISMWRGLALADQVIDRVFGVLAGRVRSHDPPGRRVHRPVLPAGGSPSNANTPSLAIQWATRLRLAGRKAGVPIGLSGEGGVTVSKPGETGLAGYLRFGDCFVWALQGSLDRHSGAGENGAISWRTVRSGRCLVTCPIG